jgi:2-methylfumaryl-CoA isomerase
MRIGGRSAMTARAIYWASLNKGKRSVTLDLKSEEGQKIATQLIAEAGTLITNLPARGWLSYENLKQHREDLVMLRLGGWHDGSPAVDYTVNAASGFPIITGDDDRPVNNAVPAWDVAAGLYIPTGSWLRSWIVVPRARARRSLWRCPMSCSPPSATSVTSPRCRRRARRAVPWAMDSTVRMGSRSSARMVKQVMVVVISNKHWRGLGKATDCPRSSR